jgi:nucleoside-diphosphate-sugar epimerase
MKKVLITGNKGFVGGNLTSFLQHKNKQIKGVSREPNAEEVSYENLTSKTLNDTSTLIHLAGKAHDLKNSANDNEYFEVNTNLTKRMFDLFIESTCKVFIYMSSVKASADEVLGELLEDATPNPITAYGKSKLAAEKYILSKQIPQNKRVYILRPCMIHGPGNKGNLNLLYQLVSMRIPWLLGLFENKRSYCSIENLSFIINELIENKNIPSGVYNVSDDNPLSTNEVISLISDSQNKEPILWNVPKFVIKMMAKSGDIFSLPLNSERLNKLTESYVVSNKKIKKAIDKPLKVNSKDGLLVTFKSFQLNNKKNKT